MMQRADILSFLCGQPSIHSLHGNGATVWPCANVDGLLNNSGGLPPRSRNAYRIPGNCSAPCLPMGPPRPSAQVMPDPSVTPKACLRHDQGAWQRCKWHKRWRGLAGMRRFGARVPGRLSGVGGAPFRTGSGRDEEQCRPRKPPGPFFTSPPSLDGSADRIGGVRAASAAATASPRKTCK